LDRREKLEFQIEQIRTKMYWAFNENNNYDHVIKLSQDLDQLLNQLDKLNKRV
jgi:sulfur transfer protein SufE